MKYLVLLSRVNKNISMHLCYCLLSPAHESSTFKLILHQAEFSRTEARFRDDVATKSLRIVYIKSIAHSVHYHHSLN